MLSRVLIAFTLLSLILVSGKEVNEENCEVCVKFIRKFADSLDDGVKSNPTKIENKLRQVCEKSKVHKENRFCYYVGGLEESATGMLGEISKPISWSMPAEKICEKLKKKDSQICELKYEKKIDLTKVDINKLKVADLKKVLSDWGETCKGCSEKSDFVRLVKELLPKYAPEAAKNQEL